MVQDPYLTIDIQTKEDWSMHPSYFNLNFWNDSPMVRPVYPPIPEANRRSQSYDKVGLSKKLEESDEGSRLEGVPSANRREVQFKRMEPRTKQRPQAPTLAKPSFTRKLNKTETQFPPTRGQSPLKAGPVKPPASASVKFQRKQAAGHCPSPSDHPIFTPSFSNSPSAIKRDPGPVRYEQVPSDKLPGP